MYDHMKNTRANFKYAFKHCKKQQDILQCDKMANNLLNKKTDAFWHLVKGCSMSNVKMSSTNEGCNGASNIAQCQI